MKRMTENDWSRNDWVVAWRIARIAHRDNWSVENVCALSELPYLATCRLSDRQMAWYGQQPAWLRLQQNKIVDEILDEILDPFE